jgi:hypothetical protein
MKNMEHRTANISHLSSAAAVVFGAYSPQSRVLRIDSDTFKQSNSVIRREIYL